MSTNIVQENNKPVTGNISFMQERENEKASSHNDNAENREQSQQPNERYDQNKQGTLSYWYRPDTGNNNGYGHQALVPLRQHMYSLPIHTRRLQVLTYALAEISSAATLIADYTRSLLNLSRRLVICWESVLHAALMWQHVERQTHHMVLQCVKRTWNKLQKGQSSRRSKKHINTESCGVNRKQHVDHNWKFTNNNKFSTSTSKKAAHSFYSSSNELSSSTSLPLPKLTHVFAPYTKESGATNKRVSNCPNESLHPLESEEQESWEEKEEKMRKGKLCTLTHNPENEKRERESQMWYKVQVAVLANKHVHKVVRHALRHYYKHENIVASQLEKLRGTVVAAILQQFLNVNVKESYHDTLLHSWLPRPQQNELENVSHSLIHSHVCNIISKLQNEWCKESEFYECMKKPERYEEEEEEEEEEYEEEEYEYSHKEESEQNNRHGNHATWPTNNKKKEKMCKSIEAKEKANKTRVQKLLKDEHQEESLSSYLENQERDTLVLPGVIRKRLRSATQSANNSQCSFSNSSNYNKNSSSKLSKNSTSVFTNTLLPSEPINVSTMNKSEHHTSKNCSRKNKNLGNRESDSVTYNSTFSENINCEEQGKEETVTNKQNIFVLTPKEQEFCLQDDQPQQPLQQRQLKSYYKYANWSNSLSLAFFMHAAASANSTLCALSVISRCVYRASHVISSDDESPQAWKRCRDWKNKNGKTNSNYTSKTVATTTAANDKSAKVVNSTKYYQSAQNKYKEFTATNNAESDLTNAEEQDEEQHLHEHEYEYETHRHTISSQILEEREEKENERKESPSYTEEKPGEHESEYDHDGFYYIIVAARAVNACNHAATCFGNRKFIFIECSDVEALLRRTEEESSYETGVSETAAEKAAHLVETTTHLSHWQKHKQSNKHHEEYMHFSHMCKENLPTASEHLINVTASKHHQKEESLEQPNQLPLISKTKAVEDYTNITQKAPVFLHDTNTNISTNNNVENERYRCKDPMNANEMWLRSFLISQHRLLPAPPPQATEQNKSATILHDAEEDEEREYISMNKRANNNKKSNSSSCNYENKCAEQCNREYDLYSCAECEPKEDQENEEEEEEDEDEDDVSSSDEPKFIVMNALYCSLAANASSYKNGNAEREDAEQLAIDNSSFHMSNEANINYTKKNNNEFTRKNNRVNDTFYKDYNTNVADTDVNYINNESALVIAPNAFTTSSSVALYETNRSKAVNSKYYDPNANSANAFSNFAHTILMPPSSGQENANYFDNNNDNDDIHSGTTRTKYKMGKSTHERMEKISNLDKSGIAPFEGDFAFSAELFARLQFWCVRGQNRSKFKACNLLQHSNNVSKHNTQKDAENEEIQDAKRKHYNMKTKESEVKRKEDEQDEDQSEWRKEFVQRPVKLLSSSVGNMTFHFTRYGATMNSLQSATDTTGNTSNIDESSVFGANIRGEELLYEALSCTSHVIICEVRESRAHKDYHDALHTFPLACESSCENENYENSEENTCIDEYIRSVNKEMNCKGTKTAHTFTLRDTNTKINKHYNDYDEGSFVELATLSDDEADPYRYDRQSRLDVRAHVEWAQGELVEETIQQHQEQESEEKELEWKQKHERSCRKPLPNRERRQRRNEMLKNEFRLARSTRLDALLVDEINDKAIATVVLEATHAPNATTNENNNTNSKTVTSPTRISAEQAVQNTTYSVVSFSQYIAPLWEHMHREKAIMVDLDRTLVDNAILLSPSLSSSSSFHAASSSPSSLWASNKLTAKNKETSQILPHMQHYLPRSVHSSDHNDCDLCCDEYMGARLSEVAELFPSLVQQEINTIYAQHKHISRKENSDTRLKMNCLCTSSQQYAYRCSVSYHVCQSAHSDDTLADFSQPPVHEIVYLRPDIRTWLHHVAIRWNIPLILVTKSTRLRAHAILSQLLDPCQLLFTNEEKQLITSCQVERAKKMSVSFNNTATNAKTNNTEHQSNNINNNCERPQVTSKSAYHVLRLFEGLDLNCTNANRKQHRTPWPEHLILPSCQARSVAIVDDAVQVWEEKDWPRAIAIAPYTLSRIDPAQYLNINGGYITSLLLSALYSKRPLTCPLAQLLACVLHSAQNYTNTSAFHNTNTYVSLNMSSNSKSSKVHCICSCVAPCCTAAVEHRRRRKREDARHVDRSIKQFHVYHSPQVIESSSKLLQLPPISVTPQITPESESMKGIDRSKSNINEYKKIDTRNDNNNKTKASSAHNASYRENKNKNNNNDSVLGMKIVKSKNSNNRIIHTPFLPSSSEVTPWTTTTGTSSTSLASSFTESPRSFSAKEEQNEEEEELSTSSLSSTTFFSSEEEEELEEYDSKEMTPDLLLSTNSVLPFKGSDQKYTDATNAHASETTKTEHPKQLLHKPRRKHHHKANMTPPTPTEFASQSQTITVSKGSNTNNNKYSTGDITTTKTVSNCGVHDICTPGKAQRDQILLPTKEQSQEENCNEEEEEQHEEEGEEHEVEEVVNAEEAVVDEGADDEVNVFAQGNQNDTFDWQFNKKNKSSSIWADDNVEDVVPL